MNVVKVPDELVEPLVEARTKLQRAKAELAVAVRNYGSLADQAKNKIKAPPDAQLSEDQRYVVFGNKAGSLIKP